MTPHEIKLLDSVENPVFVLEPDQSGKPRYVAFNAYARSIAKFSADFVIGKTALGVYPGELGGAAYNHHCQVFASGIAETYELLLPFGDVTRYVRTHLKPQLDERGNVVRLIGTSQDITTEYSVREAQANSIVLNTELEHFINLAAHDLRSPVRNIRFLADMLREECEGMGEGPSELIDKLELVAGKAMTMINDVLSHAEITGVTEAVEEFELVGLCREILATLDPHGKHQSRVSNCRIMGDKIATQVVLRNLIDNAIKHNPQDAVTLTISASSPDNQHFEITVRDNGVGFSDPTIAFLDDGEMRRENGFGLLGILRLVKARQGEIRAHQPNAGEGARITLRLPGRLVSSRSSTAALQAGGTAAGLTL